MEIFNKHLTNVLYTFKVLLVKNVTLDKLSIVLLFFQLHRELLLVKIDIPIYCITVENQQTHWWRLLVEDMSEAWSTTR